VLDQGDIGFQSQPLGKFGNTPEQKRRKRFACDVSFGSILERSGGPALDFLGSESRTFWWGYGKHFAATHLESSADPDNLHSLLYVIDTLLQCQPGVL
jgi:hypothetical protein